ncbi:hypothetical protein H9I48_04935 [Wolbachia pipientis]|uniref:hypothetical protein n=1 Tax=Wolbachia pipientis TaxID=955 RepID=UPI00165163C8|nr:hypothetical protein [Wolbachia pipientis]MBC6686545.1 hypothetical protein [Wolbachia pipientis]
MKVADTGFYPKGCHPSAQTLVLCNLIKNVCFSVRQLPLAHQLSYRISGFQTGMTPFAVFKNECSYSYE